MAGKYSVETIFKAVDKMSAPVSRMQARISKFTRSAKDGISKVADVSQNLISKSIRMGTVLAGAFTGAVAGLSAFLTLTSQASAEINNMSAAMGVSAVTTRAVGGVLSSAGMNWENFTDQIEEMTNKFGEMKGLGEMKAVDESLGILNLKFKDLKNLKPEEQYIRIMDAAIKMKDAQKAASAVDMLLSGEANKIVGVFRARGQTMEEAIAQYKRYSLYTDESVKATEDFNRAMGPLNTMISSGKEQLASLIGGALTPYIKKATDWAAANKKVVNKELEKWAQRLSDSLVWLVTNADKILLWAKYIGVALGAFIAFVAILRTLILVMTAVNLVMAMNPIVLIVLAVTALVAAIGFLIYKFFGLEGVLTAANVALHLIGAAILVMMGPVGWLIGAAVLIWKNWETVGPFFKTLWGGIVNVFMGAYNTIGGFIDNMISKITDLISMASKVGTAVKGFFSGGGGNAAAAGQKVSSPQQRTARSIEEKRNTSEVTIKDQTGRAKVTKGSLGQGVRLQHTGKP